MDAQMTQRCFILGVGAQKAGTSWLSDYIRSDPGYRHGPIQAKELHIWDRADLPIAWDLPRLTDIEASPRWKALAKQVLRSYERFLLTRMARDHDLYFNYFDRILNTGGIASDMTPAYAALSSDRLEMIQSAFASRGITTKCVFVMRDPVGRCVSAFKMNRQRARLGAPSEAVRAEGTPDAAFIEYIHSEHCRLRTRYEATIEALTAVFDPKDTAILFYETMFEPETLRGISQALGVTYRPHLVEKAVNKSRKDIVLDRCCLVDCAKLYESTYDAIAARYPKATEIWPGYRLLH
jgi:hypothetical protein